jgi:hypothetical protein
MQYFVGSLATLLVMFVFSRAYSKTLVQKQRVELHYSQSRLYDIIGPVIKILPKKEKELNTQSSKFYDKVNYRVLILDSKAYWIKDNCVYVANMVNGELDESSATKVDTMGMDKIQLKKMVYIVDKLTEGKSNDSGTPGN